jgi:RNA polymerase sigma-70 factor (sigma-E family)
MERAAVPWERPAHGTLRSVREDAPAEDEPTLEALYSAHRLRLVRLAVLLVDDQGSAEDVVQDAFAALHARWPRLHDPHRALAYLTTSVVNGSRSVLRRRRTARAYVPPHEPPGASPEAELLLAEEQRELLAAVRRLPERQRQVLVLRYWSDLSEAQIAETLGLSRGGVKSTASRALDHLEQILEGSR